MAASVLQTSLQEQLRQLMAEARADDQLDRRGAARYPFFRQVRLERPGGGGLPGVAFTRELSLVSLGLLHNVPLDAGPVAVVIPRQQGEALRLTADIVWGRPCGDGWYISGGVFVVLDGISDAGAAKTG